MNGKIVGFDKDLHYKEATTKTGSPYRLVNLRIKTSETNILNHVFCFGMYFPGNVKIATNKDGIKSTMEIPFDKRHDLPEGYTVFGYNAIRVGLKKMDDKIQYKNLFNYDGIEYILENIENDMNITADLQLKIDSYMNQGEEKQLIKYQLRQLQLCKQPIDFQSTSFYEYSCFMQEFIVINVNHNKEKNKIYITGRIINYNRSWNDMVFVIDGNQHGLLAQNAQKKLKFGDVVKAEGKIQSTIHLKEVDHVATIWGGVSPFEQENKSYRTTEFCITNITEHKEKFYKQEDFAFLQMSEPSIPQSSQMDRSLFQSDDDDLF